MSIVNFVWKNFRSDIIKKRKMIFKRYFNKDASSADVFADQFHISPYVMEIILSRGINTSEGLQEFLTPTKFTDPFLLDGMREFCERIELAAKLQDRVVVFWGL